MTRKSPLNHRSLRVVFVFMVLLGFLTLQSNSARTTRIKYPGVRLEQVNGWYELSARDAKLGDIFRAVTDVTGVKVSVNSNQADRRVNIEIQAKTVEDLLEALAESKAFVYERDGSGYKLASASVAASEQEVIPDFPAGMRLSLDETMSEDEARQLRAQGILLNSSRALRVLLRPESKALLLQNAYIDTEQARKTGRSVDVPEEWLAARDTRYYIVQFDGPVSVEDRERLEKAGIRVSHYVPHQAFAVYASPDAIAKLRNTDKNIRFVEPFHPYYKVSKEILAYFGGKAPESVAQEIDRGIFSIMMRDDAAVEATLQPTEAQILQYQAAGGSVFLTIQMPPAKIKDLARVDEVQWVETAKPRKPMNDLARRRVAALTLQALHPSLTGDGVIVAVTDTGVDYVNPGFAVDPSQPTSTNLNTRIVRYSYRAGGPTSDGLPGDNNGHGTHVAGSILGNGALSHTVVKAPGSGSPPYGMNMFAGVAPLARLVMIEDFNSFSDAEQAEISYASGARISNNSWGNMNNRYGISSAIWDALVRDAMTNVPGRQEFIAFFAAGNEGNGKDDGTDGKPSTVGEPGNAKNVITVGAIEQSRYADNLLNIVESSGTNVVRTHNSLKETDSDWQVAWFSSRGPVNNTDPRIKPDIMAPGSYVLSIQSHATMPDDLEEGPLPNRDYRYGNLDSGTNFAFYSGTSMATPIGAGAAALIYQYFTNAFGKAPSPAMMKAVLIAGARHLNTLLYRRGAYGVLPGIVDEGWGAIDVVRSVNGPRLRAGSGSVLFYDQDETSSLNTDQIYTAPQIVLGAGEGGLKIVLAWSDAPGNPANAKQLVNDLDLVVYGPNGLVYQGNFFDRDGINSYALDRYYAALGDAYNNVEVVVIPDGRAGAYTVQVRGGQVPNGPQDFALVILKGVGQEGRIAGEQPALALSSNDMPVIAYSSLDGNSNRQIYVRQWMGSLEDRALLGQWTRLDDHWYEFRGSASKQGISKTFEPSVDPSIAVSGAHVYVAWVEKPRPPQTVSYIFLKQFNGQDWVELNDSGRGTGLSGPSSYSALDPVVTVGWNNRPIVAFERQLSDTTGERVFVRRWNGANWVGLAGSDTNGLPVGSGYALVDTIAMATDLSGYPIVAWGNGIGGIEVRRWTGSAWTNIGRVGSSPYAAQPSLAVSADGQIYIAWVQTWGSYVPPYLLQQIFVARYNSGTNWVAVGASLTFPGISAATNFTPTSPSISVGPPGSIHVAWRGMSSSNTAIFVKRWNGAAGAWLWAGNQHEEYGIVRQPGTMALPAAVVDSLGVPSVAFQLGYPQELFYTNEVMVYSLVSDREPPLFAGLGSARGGTNGNVFLQWAPASDAISTSIIYRIYRSTQTWACGVQPNCSASDVFSHLIATVTNITSYTVTGLISNRVYCFGVRAVDTSGLMEMNTVMRSAGPVSGTGDNDGDCLNNSVEIAANTEPCVWDTDGDGMPDGWEWFYSTNNPSHTNSLALDPLDNGRDKVRTSPPGDGDPSQAPNYDLDGDGASNYEEYQWYAAYTSLCVTATTNWISPNPTQRDTDGDGMPDGWEIVNGFNPINPSDAAGDADADGLSNLNEYMFGTDPRATDSDGDGLADGAEVGLGLNPALTDTDLDGLDDAFEIALGSNPRSGDTGNRQLSDGDAFQLGWAPTSAVPAFHVLMNETFETVSRTNWTHKAVNAFLPVNLWHLSLADPSPNLSGIRYVYERSTNTSYRFSKGTNFEAQVTNNYSGFGAMQAALDSPVINATNTATLFVSWNEWYSTEPNGDFVQVLARGGANTNWVVVTPAVSGKSGVSESDAAKPAVWTRRTADISRFAGQTNVQVRFLFKANGVNNEFPGWYVDDVMVYEGARISGWVRNINGGPVQGATVVAMGRGGVTNIVNGHRVVLPAKVLGETKTAADGSYEIRGLPRGWYYVQATAPGHIGEFFNGPLFSGAYGFGAQLNPGVVDRFLVGAGGYLALTNAGVAYTNCHFELEKGRGRAYLGVMMSNVGTNRYPVTINGLGTDFVARVWNGVTNAATAGFQVYLTATNAVLPLNRPDWLTNVVTPTLLGDLDAGNQEIIPPTNFAWLPCMEVSVREGDAAWVDMRTNHPHGWAKVTAGDGGAYRIWIDYRATTNFTPATIRLPAGTHTIMLAPTNTPRIAPQRVEIPRGNRIQVVFDASALTSAPGRVYVETRDLRGNVVTGASIFVNGQRLSVRTPVLLEDLLPGVHRLTVRKEGFRPSEIRSLNVNSAASNTVLFTLADADEDYDRVGDVIEVAGYANIFHYHRNSDPDADGLNNLIEYEQFRLYNIFLNPFDRDTDRDAMSDGAELSYDGVTNYLGISTLETNVVQGSPVVRVRFVGRYLEGVCNFGTTGPRAISIEGDRFVAGTIAFPALPVPSVDQTVVQFAGISTTGVHQSVSQGHNKDAVVYSDALPDRVDTDEDGMWDGFEHQYGLATVAELDPIERGRGTEDPDFDGLDNYREFLGPDFAANTNDWSSPVSSDTDGDGIPDGWEYFYGFNPNDPSDAFADPDHDGLVNLSEYYAGTNPKLADTDADFLPDFEEVAIYMTDPLNLDTDNDGLIDGREVWDRDLDGLFDGGFFPNWDGGDMDGDGYMDGPTDWDTDGDGMPDGFEVLDEFGRLRNDPRLNPANPNDADDDPDGDGLSNLQEYLVRDTLYGNNPFGAIWDYSTDPFKSDSDNDGMPDGWEVIHGLHPMDPIRTGPTSTATRYEELGRGGDLDGDGLWNFREYALRFHYDSRASSNAIYSLSTDPWNPDTDGDGLTDGQEDRAFLSHAILQDTDRDRLMDGVQVPNRWGEAESTLRASEYQVVTLPPCPFVVTNIIGTTTNIVTNRCTWSELAEIAQVPHPTYPYILGHLAVINSSNENDAITSLLSGGITNYAIGGTSRNANVYWVNREAWLEFANWATGEPAETRGVLGMNNLGEWYAAPTSHMFGGYVIEWSYVPTVTNHYDQALNDVWLLKWPSAQDLPHWERANVDTNYPWPPPRWGHAVTYVPVFETKRPRNDKADARPDTRVLLDNRQMVVFGGRDGVTTHKDVWELLARSNKWIWSEAPMNSQFPLLMDGLAEFQAFTILDYKNTGCITDPSSSWWDTEEFGLPKNRPWFNSRSFEWTYLLGGWDDAHRYNLTHLYYKSTDDLRPIREDQVFDKGVTEFWLHSPTGGNIRFSSTFNRGRWFAVGGAGRLLSPDDNPEGLPLPYAYVASGYAAVNISGFALTRSCDEIVSADLILRVVQAPATAFTVDIFAEISIDDGFSLPDYSTDPDGLEPYKRDGGAAFFNTTVTNFTIPASVGDVAVNVADLVRQILARDNWQASRIGFVLRATNTAEFALIRLDRSRIDVAYRPSYKKGPQWESPTRVTYIYTTQRLSSRKGVAVAYDYKRKRSLVFGGIDGNEVFGDTHEGLNRFTRSPVFNPKGVTYVQVVTEKSPPARWGANLVYDPYKEQFVLFGGFDANHRPLNDLWIYKPQTIEETTTIDEEGGEQEEFVVSGPAQWIEVKTFSSLDRPQPRGGASMVFWGGFDYNRAIEDYCVSGNKKKIVLFGGTDGKTYFNDTWVYDYDRWILVNPVGEQSQSPWPRAFASLVWAQNADSLRDPNGDAEFNRSDTPPCAGPAAILFGGRTGTLSGGRDTDGDMVDDGAEHELGGAQLGRDPRINRLVYSTNAPSETIPYSYLRIGPRPSTPLRIRGAIANFESLRHDDGIYACGKGLPWEATRGDLYSQVGVNCGDSEAGVDAARADQTKLWYHRYGGENPFDPRDVWELGRPDNSSAAPNAVPPVARSGRWCYGTNLRGTYPNNAIMDLYSPLLDLRVPSPDATATNANSYFLVFWEWVDLKDSNDVIRIDAVRPSTPADVLTRRTGVGRPVLPVLPDRNCGHNTTGEWRKVIVPLDNLGNESNVYLRFTLQTDSSGVAGGWYIDDVAVMQGWEIFGSNLPPFVLVSLYGTNINGNAQATTVTDANGNYSFGFLPLGAYNLGVLDGTANINGAPGASATLEITNIVKGATAKIQWPSVPGLTYRVDYADPSSGPNWLWYPLITVLASGTTEQHTDPAALSGRIYRVVILGGP